jgi:hypothetical protein
MPKDGRLTFIPTLTTNVKATDYDRFHKRKIRKSESFEKINEEMAYHAGHATQGRSVAGKKSWFEG